MKILFFGTSNFAVKILQGLIDSEHQIVGVVTQPDKPVGRKQEIQQSTVSEIAKQHNLHLLKPQTLKDIAVEEQIKDLNADLFVVAAYGKIIPKNILDLAPKGALNVHGSLLPKLRGSSPIQAAILEGLTETGNTIMLMDELMDHGPILAQKTVEINPDDTYQDLEQKMAESGQILLINSLPNYLNGTLLPQEQQHSDATITKIIEKANGKIDWSKSAQEIYNQYRAYFSWPGVWTNYKNQIFKIHKCTLYEVQDPQHKKYVTDFKAGTIQQEGKNIFVVCGSGFLQLQEIQLEGKKTTSPESFLAGHSDFVGTQLG